MQKAKIYLAEALMDLMQEKELKDISIKELVKKAGVSRMTYYRYFWEKEEILESYMKYLMEEYMTLERNNKFKFRSYDHILQSLLFFKDYKKYALCLHKARLDTLMLDCLNRYVSRGQRHSFSLYYYAGALFNTYMQWVLEDMKTPAEELAAIIYKAAH